MGLNVFAPVESKRDLAVDVHNIQAPLAHHEPSAGQWSPLFEWHTGKRGPLQWHQPIDTRGYAQTRPDTTGRNGWCARDISAIVLLLRCPLRTAQDIVGSGAERRNEVRGRQTDRKSVELRIDMQLLCLFHSGDRFILVTRAKQHIGYRSTWPRGFESSQDTCQVRRVGRYC